MADALAEIVCLYEESVNNATDDNVPLKQLDEKFGTIFDDLLTDLGNFYRNPEMGEADRKRAMELHRQLAFHEAEMQENHGKHDESVIWEEEAAGMTELIKTTFCK
jgi:hypothetical protein